MPEYIHPSYSKNAYVHPTVANGFDHPSKKYGTKVLIIHLNIFHCQKKHYLILFLKKKKNSTVCFLYIANNFKQLYSTNVRN